MQKKASWIHKLSIHSSIYNWYIKRETELGYIFIHKREKIWGNQKTRKLGLHYMHWDLVWFIHQLTWISWIHLDHILKDWHIWLRMFGRGCRWRWQIPHRSSAYSSADRRFSALQREILSFSSSLFWSFAKASGICDHSISMMSMRFALISCFCCVSFSICSLKETWFEKVDGLIFWVREKDRQCVCMGMYVRDEYWVIDQYIFFQQIY